MLKDTVPGDYHLVKLRAREVISTLALRLCHFQAHSTLYQVRKTAYKFHRTEAMKGCCFAVANNLSLCTCIRKWTTKTEKPSPTSMP